MRLGNRKSKTTRGDSVLDGLYHEYALFGKTNRQAAGHFAANQQAKAPIITAYIALAIAKVKDCQENVSFVELFCADAYYAMAASRLGATTVAGIDSNKDGYADADKVMEIARELDVANLTYINSEISEVGREVTYDIVANVGGLYHVNNPEEILEQSYAMAKRFLIVQSVVSLATDDEYYFEAPAPGWDWGCRYSRASFDRMIESKDYKILERHFNILQGNERPEDRGSAYYLIEKQIDQP
jgi:hypothetical protein